MYKNVLPPSELLLNLMPDDSEEAQTHKIMVPWGDPSGPYELFAMVPHWFLT